MKTTNSAHGKRCGETHPAAVLTDREVELLRQLHEADGLGYRRLAAKFEISKSAVRDICKYRYR